MIRKKKGFTLVELLATIIILGLLVTIAYISVSSILNRGNDSYYKSQEDMLVLAGREYFADHRSELPKEIGDTSTVTLETLIEEKYIDPIKDKDEVDCDKLNSNVTAQKITEKDFQYYGTLACGGYTTTGDKAKPTISFDPGKKSSESPITVTMKITDNEEVKSYRYVITKDGEEYQDSGYQTYNGNVTINLTELGLYKITGYAIDSSGNMSTRNSGQYSYYKGIDCSKVDISSSLKKGTITNKDVSISFKLPSNTYRIELSKQTNDGEYELIDSYIGNTIPDVVLDTEGRHQVRAVLYDKEGNSCTAATEEYNIDKTAPELSVSLKKKKNKENLDEDDNISSLEDYEENTWYDGYVVSRGSCSDSGSDCEISYKVTGDSENTDGFVDKTTRNINAEGTSTIEYRVTDEAGNTTTKKYTVKLSRSAPELSVSLKKKKNKDNLDENDNISSLSNYTNNTWYDGYVVLRGSCSSNAGDCTVSYRVTGSSENTDGFVDKTTRNINAEGTSTIEYRVTDEAGNTTTKKYTVKLSRSAPELSVSLKKKKNKDNLDENDNISSLSNYTNNTWYNGYVVLRGSCSSNVGDCTVSYKVTGDSENTDGFVNKTTRNINAEGTSTIEYRATDEAGNTTTKKYTVKLSRTGPSLSVVLKKKNSKDNLDDDDNISSLENYTNNTWYNGYVVLRGTCSGGQGKCTVSYKVTGSSENTYGYINKTTRNINAEGASTVEYRATDEAGNVTTKTYVVKISRNGPALSVDLKKKTSSADLDDNADISSLENYTNNTWYDGYVVLRGSCSSSQGSCTTSYKITGDSNNTNGYVQGSTVNINSEGTTTVEFMATDKAGNTSTQTYIIKLSRSMPELSVVLKKKANGTDLNDSSDISSLQDYTNNTWYNGYVVLRGSCSGGQGKCTVSYKVTGASTNTDGYETATTRNINAEGTSTIEYRATDEAGNVTSETYTVKIDRSKPTISFNVTGGTYSKSSLKICATIKDNLGIDKLNFQVWTPNGTGDRLKIVNNSDVNSTSEEVCYTLSGYRKYRVYAKAYDYANNKQSKSPENDSGYYYQDYTLKEATKTMYLCRNGNTFINWRKTTSCATVDANRYNCAVTISSNINSPTAVSVKSSLDGDFYVMTDPIVKTFDGEKFTFKYIYKTCLSSNKKPTECSKSCLDH